MFCNLVLTIGAIPLDGEDFLLSRRNCIDVYRKIVGLTAYLLSFVLTYERQGEQSLRS